MPNDISDEKMDLIKKEIESGKRFPDAVKSVVAEDFKPMQIRRKMVEKYGRKAFRDLVMNSSIPNFERIPSMIKNLEPRLVDLDQVKVMLSNLSLAMSELERIKNNISS